MKFKKYLQEMEGVAELDPNVSNVLADCKKILETMTDDEIDEFGYWLFTELYDDTEYGDETYFDKDEVIEMLISLSSNDLQYVHDVLNLPPEEIDGSGNIEGDYEDDEYSDGPNEDITEKKFFKTKKIQLNRLKKTDRVARRKKKKARKIDYRKHKAVIKRKQKKYRRKVKRNPNMVRRHR